MPVSEPTPSWDVIRNKPTTMSGFGITDEKCRAWVNFNGTGTVAIRSSYNVSSITDNGVGDYTVNFTTAMPDANYGFTFGGVNAVGTNNGTAFTGASFQGTQATSSIRVLQTALGGGSNPTADPTHFSVAIFR
jgi:hypothetical protein